jgi:hypothetical protein
MSSAAAKTIWTVVAAAIPGSAPGKKKSTRTVTGAGGHRCPGAETVIGRAFQPVTFVVGHRLFASDQQSSCHSTFCEQAWVSPAGFALSPFIEQVIEAGRRATGIAGRSWR